MQPEAFKPKDCFAVDTTEIGERPALGGGSEN